MKKLIYVLVGVFFFNTATAHEGMWLMHMLKRINEAEMHQLGLNLTAEEIYDINNASLKDAIVRLNGGMCTAEVISDKGLVLTNHHCTYGSVQGLATVENDILTNGFWAYSHDEELAIPDFYVSFLNKIEDVTDEVLKNVTDDMSEEERNGAIQAAIAEIKKRTSEENGITLEVKSFFYGNEFYSFEYTSYNDVRLVGVPPESVGKFGGDTDNWMWPRHTGDFSMIRVYSDADNNPSEFSETNVPYTPKHSLPVSLDGVEAGDFTMIMGYPGSTDRFLSSYGVKQAIDIHNPSVVEVRDMKLNTMDEHMDADPKVRLQYASKHARTANYWKYYIGQTKGLKALDVYGKKQGIEKDFQKWASATPERKAKYGDALSMIEEYYKSTDATEKGNVYALEAGLIGPDITLFAFRFSNTYRAAMKEEDAAVKAQILESLKGSGEDFFKDYDQATDKDLFVNLMNMYYKNITAGQQPNVFRTIDGKYKGSVERYAEKMYDKSFLVDKDKYMAFLDNPNDKAFQKDLAVACADDMITKYRASFANDSQDKFDRGYRLFVDGLRQMNKDKKYYPDANSTMRLTYGVVGDYYPADAVHYDFVTTADGILQKKDNTNPEFVVNEKLEKLIRAKKFGQYADDNGKLVTCFISNNDITGGNSGSPVINADGHIIGVAFDGNWEAMSGDIAFETEIQRTISVDIRYVMFVVDKLAGAKNIIDEIKFVKSAPEKVVAPVAAENAQVEEQK